MHNVHTYIHAYIHTYIHKYIHAYIHTYIHTHVLLRWVHLKCLRRWQRGVLVGQPTHPDFYEDDVRHRVCNVCNSEYTCKPPSRLELMSSFTGAELAALVEETCFIGSSRSFSQELLRQVGIVPESLREVMVDSHWIHGVFLIAQVIEESNAIIKLKANDEDDLQTFASQLTEDYCCRMRGRSYRLIFEGRLQDVALRGCPQKSLGCLQGSQEKHSVKAKVAKLTQKEQTNEAPRKKYLKIEANQEML